MLVCISYADMLENLAFENMSRDDLLENLLYAMDDTTKKDLLEYILRCIGVEHVSEDEYELEWIDA